MPMPPIPTLLPAQIRDLPVWGIEIRASDGAENPSEADPGLTRPYPGISDSASRMEAAMPIQKEICGLPFWDTKIVQIGTGDFCALLSKGFRAAGSHLPDSET